MTTHRLLEVLPQVRLQVTLDVPLSEHRDYDYPAVTRWSGQATLPVAALLEAEDGSGSPEGLQAGDAAAGLSLGTAAGQDAVLLAAADGLSIDLTQTGPLHDVLDESADYAHFLPMLSETGESGLPLELEEDDRVNPFGTTWVILDSVELAPAWRGLGGVGQLLVGKLLEPLMRDASLVVTYPFPRQFSGRGDDPAFAPALAKLEQVAAGVGFVPWRYGIWCLSPHLVEFGSRMLALEARLGLPRATGR